MIHLDNAVIFVLLFFRMPEGHRTTALNRHVSGNTSANNDNGIILPVALNIGLNGPQK